MLMLHLFSARSFKGLLNCSRNRLGTGESLARAPVYEPAPFVCDSALLLEKRLSTVDTIAPKPQEVLSHSVVPQPTKPSRAHNRVRSFSLLESSILNPQVTYR